MAEPKSGTVIKGPNRKYSVVKVLQSGAQGVACLVTSGGKEYFLKYIQSDTPFSDKASGMRFQQRQEELAKRLAEIANFVGAVEDFFIWDDHYCRVDRFVEGKSLEEHLRAAESEPNVYPLEDRMRDAKVLAFTLTQVHGKGIVHLDLKPANVMLQMLPPPPMCVAIDFDLGFLESERPPEVIGYTPGYGAPEQLLYGSDGTASPQFGPPSRASDVFALGAILHDLLLGEAPWVSSWEDDCAKPGGVRSAKEMVTASGLSYPGEVLEIMTRCLSPLPAARPTAAQVHATLLQRLQESAPVKRPEPPAVLHLVLPGTSPLVVPNDQLLTLGRSLFVGIAGSDTVSGQHAQIGREPGGWFIWHLSRTNSTTVVSNGHERRLSVPSSKAELQVGDRVRLGKLEFEIQ